MGDAHPLDLVERDDELHTIERALDRADAGSGSVLVVTGPAGIGKSALLGRTVAHAATRPGWTTLEASGGLVGRDVAQLVLRQWFGRLARGVPPGGEPFDGPGARIRDLLYDVDSPAAAADLAYSTSWVLEGLAATGPVLLVVDDLHWTDAGSRTVVEHLARTVAGDPVLLVVASRSGESDDADTLVSRLAGQPAAQTLRPAPLSTAAVAALAGTDAAASGELHRRTGGLPFLVSETLAWTRAGGIGTPPRVADSVSERLGRLGADAASAAAAVVVLGGDARLEHVVPVAGLDREPSVAALDRLVRAGLLDARGEPWRTVHPLVAEAVRDRTPPAHLAELHARAAARLAGTGGGDGVIAAHLLHAPRGTEPGTVALLHRVATDALAHGSAPLAVDLLRRALEERVDDASGAVGLLTLLGRALLLSGDANGAVARWREAADRTTDLDARVGLLADLAEAALAAGRFADAETQFDAALGELDAAGVARSSQTRRLLVGRSGVASLVIRGADAHIEGFEQMLDGTSELLHQPESDDTPADRVLLAGLSSLLVFHERNAELAGRLAQRSLGGERLLVEHTCDGGIPYVSTGALNWAERYDVAIDFLSAAMAQARERGSVLGHATAAYCRGYVRWRAGDIGAAEADIDAALQARADGWSTYLEPCLSVAAELRLARGDAAAAAAVLAELPELPPSFLLTPFYDYGKGVVAQATGDAEEALAAYTRVRDAAGPAPVASTVLPWRERTAEVLYAGGERERAHELALDAVARSRAFGAPRALGASLLTLAAVTGEPDEHADLLRQAVETLDSSGGAYDRARAQVEFGLHLAETGDADTAADLLTAAYGYARAQGLHPLQDRSARGLRRIGRPVHDGGASRVALLSPGERRVCELAARGLTNRQIARELFVTVKAVEWHLSRAFPKLGVSSRRDLPELFMA